MSGIDTSGFDRMTQPEILAEIVEDERAEISASLNTASDTVVGQINGITSDNIASAWELAEACYNALNPDAAEGTALDNLCALTGTTRLPATYATASVICVGTAATVVDADKQIELNDYGWSLDAAATIAAATAWAPATAYVVGDLRMNDTPSKIYRCVTAGTSAGAGGPTGTTDGIADNTAVWNYLAAGTGVVTAAFTADETGTGPSGNTENEADIVTAVSGWAAAFFASDSTDGTAQELDSALRIRREQLLAEAGNATESAVLADVLAVADVTSAAIFVNDGDTVDADGVPAHGFEVVVLGGDDDEIAQAIWDSKSAGIEAHGDDSGTATDSASNSQTVEFTRPTEVDIYLDYTVTTDSDFPVDGDTQIKNALTTWGNALGVGQDVVYAELWGVILGIAGVTDVTLLEIGTAPAPAGTVNIAITDRQISAWDSADITVI